MSGLDELMDAGPWPQRAVLRGLIALARRPRGLALLRKLSPADEAATSLLALEAYEDPERAAKLGWDPEAVVSRGRALRRAESRP